MPNRKRPMHGKGAVLNARVTAETRAALEAEAARSGHSLSTVAEQWLDATRRQKAQQALNDLLRMLLQDGATPDPGTLRMAAARLQELNGEPHHDD